MGIIERSVLWGTAIVRPLASRRQCARTSLAIALAAVVGGCTVDDLTSGVLGMDSTPTVNVATRYFGAVAGDDPQAVDVGRRVLLSGGTAADAAAAMGLTLTVTLPSRASLDGGGLCLVHDPDSATVDEVDFLPPAQPGAAVQIPGLVRGLAALQAHSGVFRWQQAVAPAEQLARDGIAVTALLLDDLKAVGLEANGPGGEPLKEGDILPQRAVAELLSEVRTKGALDFYRGGGAEKLVAAGLPAGPLAAWAPTWHAAVSRSVGTATVWFPNEGAGPQIQAALGALAGKNLDAAGAFAAARSGVTDAPAASTSFAVNDARGRAVICAITMGKLFGTGHIVEGLDIYGAAVPDAATVSSLAPMVAISPTGSFIAAADGGQGSAAGADAAAAVTLALTGVQKVDVAVSANRVPTEGPGTAVPDRVNAIHCPDGVPDKPDSCLAVHDSRGSGYATVADRLTQ